MALSVWISSASQYGVLAPGESKAQQGAAQRAVAQAIKRHLFEDDDTYARVLGDFAGRLRAGLTIGKEWEAARRLWQALLPEEETAPPTVAELPSSPVPERIEALFGLALHCLCAPLAGQWVDGPNRDPDDNEIDGGDDDDETDAPPGAPLAVEHAQVVGVLVEQLRQITWKWRRDLPEDERPEAEAWRILARALLDNLLAALGGWFAVQTGNTRHRDGKPHTEKRIEIRNPALEQRIERLLRNLPLHLTPQPLISPVFYGGVASAPTDDAAETAIRIDLIGYRRTNAFMRSAQRGILHADHCPPVFARYVEAIDLQQSVPWRVNRDLLHWTRALIATVDAAPNAHDEDAGLPDWVRENLYRPKQERPRTRFHSKRDRDSRKARPGEFLDHPAAGRALDALCPSDPLVDRPAFYLPWKADYRGRIYAQTAWLNPQGGDLQRALLEFARGQALTEAGVGALRRHGANLIARGRLLSDLGIDDRQVLTLEERERWVVEHEHAILASAADPLAEPFWREAADKPMQFLAFCLAYRQWMEQPEGLIHLPVQIDGTCNGIQHIAALTGDAQLARAVNVLPRQDGLPADIYSELAERARQTLGQVPIPKGQAVHRDGLKLADAWLAADPARRAWLDRKTAKKVVMTIPYGASRGAQAQGVLEAIEERIVADWQRDPPPLSKLDVLIDKIKNDETYRRRAFVARCTRDRFDEARRRAFAGDDELVKTLALVEWERLRTFGAYVALILVEHLRGALDRNYPKVGKFSAWLEDIADSISFPRYSKTQLEKLVAETTAALDRKTKLSELEKLVAETTAALDRKTKLSENQIKKLVGAYKKATEAKFESPECQGLPLLWLTPLGFPVVQNQFKSKGTSVTVRFGAQSIKIDVQRLTEDVEPGKQRDALLPNLIHSLDATHLMMTLLEARAHGVNDIGSVHDCLLCHPNRAETLAQTVRQTFAELYAPDEKTGLPKPLSAWKDWMEQVVELRTLPRRGTLKAMLDHPGGMGERMLEQEADAGKPDASDARAWLAKIRDRTPPPARFLLSRLLEQAADLPTPKTPPSLPTPPAAAALPLNADAVSEYFFS
ncbi:MULTISPECIES: DNA-directed RNA polymerase [unclassified Thiocapsa]|uniref:DNA-directed RNA polymerase n=1 Tax=unclassified Thiocapsa TaxID=2641286 RepID=UPI0035AFC975